MRLIIFVYLLLALGCAHEEKEVSVKPNLEMCPSSPNCVVSLYPEDKKHYIEPIKNFPNSINKIKSALKAMNLSVVTEEQHYIHATATSTFFRFVDDIQIKIEGDLIHFRSASRTGYSDFGVNRKRIEKLKLILLK